MAKIKYTKTELKAQRESLARFQRFLPMLQLKKQQLQAELQRVEAEAEAFRLKSEAAHKNMQPWMLLLSEDVPLESYVSIKEVRIEDGNIAGVPIPVLEDVVLDIAHYDIEATPPWVDAAVEVISKLFRLNIAAKIFKEQARRIAVELRITAQRVNLFEKIKIPECRDNIRAIRISLGDQQTAGVARAKIAKSRSEAAA